MKDNVARIAVLQLNSKLDPAINLKKIAELLHKAREQKAQYAFLPECFYSMSDGQEITPHLVEEGNNHFQKIQALACEFELFLLAGSCASVNPKDDKALNRSFNFSPTGDLIGVYDKNHLFSCDLSRHQSKKVLDEALIYAAGSESLILSAGPMKIGLGICFDLRFPEMSRKYFSEGANVLTFSSAFTVPTGKAHWHTLLRARAIENQSFVVASAQWGVHNDKISTYGHSLVVDPWGEVLMDLKEGESVGVVDLDFNHLNEVRSRLVVDP